MKFKLNKRFLIFICALVSLVLCIFSIRNTFARYVTSLTAKSYVELGTWLIRLNNQNIVEKSDFSAKLTPVFDVDSEYIADGKIVPTSSRIY